MLNKILILCDKEEIKQIKEFKIIREDLLKVDGIKFFNNNQFLFDHFFHKHNDLGNLRLSSTDIQTIQLYQQGKLFEYEHAIHFNKQKNNQVNETFFVFF